MTQEIQIALLNLFSACIELTGRGTWHAFIDYAAHTDAIWVQVLPASTEYSGESDYQPALKAHVYLSGEASDTPGLVLQRLRALTDSITGLMQEEAA